MAASMDASDSKQDAIKSAKQKLKSYRAKQKRQSDLAHSRQLSHSRRRSSVDLKPSAVLAGKRLSLQAASTTTAPPFEHKHKRSLSSRNATPFTFPPKESSAASSPTSGPPVAPSASAHRRVSMPGRRHSRTESILDTSLVNGQVTPIPESWSFPKSPGLQNASASSARLSIPTSPYPFSQQSNHSITSGPPPPAASSSSLQHARKGSRHSRQLSLATRRESMDLMAGLNVTSPAMPWSHPDELSPEDERRNALDALEGRSTPPKPEVPLAPAPQPEPTAPPQDPPSPEHWRSAFPASNMVNKRASWGAIPTTAEPVKSDLGSLIEEEEEEEGVAELPSMASPPAAQGKRHRPASLCFPPRSASRSSNIIAETHGTPSSSTYPPFDSAISFNPEYHKSPPPPPADDVSAAARRPLKSLSLSLSSSSNTSTSAALPSSPASGCNATADQTTTKQQRRASGLRSLTLASNNSRLPNSPSLSSLPDVPSPATNAAMSPLANRRVSIGAAGSRSRAASLASSGNSSRQRPKGSSISYRYNGEPTNNSMWQRCASQDEDEQSEWGANESDFGAMSESASAVAALRSQIDTLQHEASGLREELATAKALHASSSASAADAASVLEKRVAELQTRLSEHSDAHKLSQNQLENEVAEMRAQLQDAVDERDALVEDVDGWRSRCSDLTHALQREKQALDTEKKDGALAREKVRKLGDRLAAMSGPQEASPENDDALTTAQAKLINEMRDQIFSLAAALDQEKRQHHSVAQQFEELQQQQQQQQAAWPLESSGASFLPSSLSSSSSSFGAAADDSSFTTQSSFESAFGNHKPDFSTSLNAGALHTLAEEDEEEEDAVTALEQPTPRDDEAGWSDEDQVPELDFRGTQTRAQHLQGGASKPGSTASSVSLNDIQETRTPPLPQQPTESSHRRSDSFIKQWTFPKGPVTPLHILQPDDHCFFSISTSEVLPPLPVDQDALEFPQFFSSDLAVDEEERRRSLDLQAAEAHSRASSSSTRSSGFFASLRGSTTAPPPARSAQLSSSLHNDSPASSKSRMSLQGLGYLISSYVAPHHDLHEQELSSSSSVMPGAMGNPHTREQSVFADIESQPQQLFRPAPSTANQVVDRYTPQRPRASPLNVLDFRQACGAPAKQIITV